MQYLKILLLIILLSGCSSLKQSYTPEQIKAESDRINVFFKKVFDERLSRSPMWQTSLGLKTNLDKLNRLDEESQIEEYEFTKSYLKELDGFNYDMLDEQTKISYKIFKHKAQTSIDNWKWRHHNYPVNQMYGTQSRIPAFLISKHKIDSESDAKAYIARLNDVPRMLGEQIDQLKIRENKGIIAPKFVFPLVIGDSENLIKNYPFTKTRQQSPLFKDFIEKVDKLKISKSRKRSLKKQAKTALLKSVKPAYQRLITYLKQLQKKATTNRGVWSLPGGDRFYNARLRKITTTDLTADEIHSLGLSEVSRIHLEMKKIMQKVGFSGSLQDFFKYTRTDRKFYFKNTKKDRKKYLDLATKYIADMKMALPKMFDIQPKASVEVRPVEDFRSKSAGKAFYSSPPPNGSRPGIYYINLYDMTKVTSYEAEALAYHEGIPGHHMQNAIAIELKDIPRFRKHGWFTAYGEGWALYSEFLAKEYGFYQDPYSDFGRLTMELWRACRLVVDTGIHRKKWSHEKAVAYLKNNTPNPEHDIVKAIDRYFIMPGQATAYKIGMLKILQLRKSAKDQLGDKFDIRKFHNIVLKGGAMPLSIMEARVDHWISSYQ